MYNRIISSDNSGNLGIWCHKLTASGGKYKFISGKYFVSETWIFFFYFYFTTCFYTEQSQKTKMWAKHPLNQSCSLIPAASGFSTSKDSSWESYLLMKFSFWVYLSLGHFHDFSLHVPGSLPFVPPVGQDFSTEKSHWHEIHGWGK